MRLQIKRKGSPRVGSRNKGLSGSRVGTGLYRLGFWTRPCCLFLGPGSSSILYSSALDLGTGLYSLVPALGLGALSVEEGEGDWRLFLGSGPLTFGPLFLGAGARTGTRTRTGTRARPPRPSAFIPRPSALGPRAWAHLGPWPCWRLSLAGAPGGLAGAYCWAARQGQGLSLAPRPSALGALFLGLPLAQAAHARPSAPRRA